VLTPVVVSADFTFQHDQQVHTTLIGTCSRIANSHRPIDTVSGTVNWLLATSNYTSSLSERRYAIARTEDLVCVCVSSCVRHTPVSYETPVWIKLVFSVQAATSCLGLKEIESIKIWLRHVNSKVAECVKQATVIGLLLITLRQWTWPSAVNSRSTTVTC